MESKRKWIAGLVFVFLAGGVVGLAAGGYGGFRRGFSFILNEALFKDAREVESHLAILKQLRAGERDKAVEALEARTDDILILFDPDTPFSGLDPSTTAEIRKAIGEAKAYRSAHPRQSKPKFRDEMIHSLFSRDLYK